MKQNCLRNVVVVVAITALCLAVVNFLSVRELRTFTKQEMLKASLCESWFYQVSKVGEIEFPAAVQEARLTFMAQSNQVSKTTGALLQDIAAGTTYECYSRPEKKYIRFVLWCPTTGDSESFGILNPGIPPDVCVSTIEFADIRGAGSYTLLNWDTRSGAGDLNAQYRITLDIEEKGDNSNRTSNKPDAGDGK